VFFVDDESQILASIRRAMADEPFEVRTFLDPEEALAQIASERPAVVVSDFYMPAIQGPDLLKKVCEIDRTIIRMILTGKPDLPAVLSALEKGEVQSFLVKPWDNEKLRMAVRDALRQHRCLVDRNAVMGRIQAAERRDFRELLRQDAQKHLAGLRKPPRPGDEE
jgi:FixJ family two-component response regulator